jgi:hypothetical protein
VVADAFLQLFLHIFCVNNVCISLPCRDISCSFTIMHIHQTSEFNNQFGSIVTK